MRVRRLVSYAAAIMVAAIACYTVFVTKPFAQEMMGPPDMMGGDMGMMGGPGGGGGGGGGRNYQWTEVEMPEALLMTYGEFLAEEGQPPVPIPEVYLLDDEGVPKKCTRNMWYSLARVYEDKPVEVKRDMTGKRGGKMWRQVWLEAAVKHNEVNAVWDRWVDALSNFTFEVGYPRIGPQALAYDWERKSVRHPDGSISWQRWEATLPDSFTITVPVVMQVKPNCQKTYGQKFYNALKKFDNRGHGRHPFTFMTYSGGHYKPNTFYLADDAIQVWNDLWPRVEVQLRLFDVDNVEIVRASQASGLSPSIFTQMALPPTMNYNPRYRLLMPDEDKTFNGGKLNLEDKRGWYFEFEFTLNKEQLQKLDGASARIWTGGTTPNQMKFIGAPATGGATGGGGGMGGMEGGMMGGDMGGGMPGMPGGPGAGAMGSGPPM